MGGCDETQGTHWTATARTERHGSPRRGEWSGGTPLDGPAGMTLHAHAVGAGGGMTEAVVPDGSQAARENMPEVARDKLHAREGADLAAVARRPVLPPEADGVIVDARHAGIAERGAGDVGPEILEGGAAVAGWLNVNAPIFAPNGGIDLPVMNPKEFAQMFPEGRLQERQVEEIVRLSDAHEASAPVESGAGDQAVDMGMKSQLLIPGVEDRGEATGGGPQPFGGGQLLGKRSRDGGEEQIVSLFGEGPEEAGAQLRRECEGDQEVGRLDELVQLALDPLGGGRTAALRTGLVIAGMPGEVNLVTIRAGKGPPAQSRSAAVGDGPEGAVLIRGERRGRVQELR